MAKNVKSNRTLNLDFSSSKIPFGRHAMGWNMRRGESEVRILDSVLERVPVILQIISDKNTIII